MEELLKEIICCQACECHFFQKPEDNSRCIHYCSDCLKEKPECEECQTLPKECLLSLATGKDESCSQDAPSEEENIFEEPFRLISEELKKTGQSYTMPTHLLERARQLGISVDDNESFDIPMTSPHKKLKKSTKEKTPAKKK